MKEDAPQREHSLRGFSNDLGYMVRTGVQEYFLPNDLPLASTVYQQSRRWLKAGDFDELVRGPAHVEARNHLPQPITHGSDPGQPIAVIER